MSKYTTLQSISDYVEVARNNLIALGFTELKGINLLIEWNTRAHTRLGQCCPRRNVAGVRYFILNFNKEYCEVGDDKNVEGTIIHEVAHCVNNGLNHEHTGGWYKAVTAYNAVYGTNITRTTSDEKYSAYLAQHKRNRKTYLVFCQYCGKDRVATYHRQTKAIKGIKENPYNWKCGRCGRIGSLYVIE